MAGEYQVDGLAVPESLDVLHDLLERVGLEHPEVAPADLMLFETAVIEIAGNVVEHGRPAGKVSYGFSLSVLPDRLEALLSDSGEAFDGAPAEAEVEVDELAEHGRGLILARTALDELSHSYEDGENRWRMTRRRRRQ